MSQHGAVEFSTVPDKTIDRNGCQIVVRRFDGPIASELFAHCSPGDASAETGSQAESLYRTISEVLAAEGASFDTVVTETVFLRNIDTDISAVRTARKKALTDAGAVFGRSAINEIQQPPLLTSANIAVSFHAVVPLYPSQSYQSVEARSEGAKSSGPKSSGLRVDLGDEARFFAAGLGGSGDNAHEQTLGMFGLAEELLNKAGMDFRDVVRTWIYLRDMERDYDSLNKARRAFFNARNIDPVPASTGIGGAPASASHDLSLGIYAVKAATPPVRTVMTSPTLNEAMSYGADFVRGLRVPEANRVALHVSGTASIDENGKSAHRDDFDAQAERMLLNIAALLEGQGASFSDVVSAIAYVKHPENADRLRVILENAGFSGFPIAMVEAPICRPDLLCETEVLALLPTRACY